MKKTKIKQDFKARKDLKKSIQIRPEPTKFSKKELDQALSVLISDEDLVTKALVIMSTFKDNKKMLYIALSKHLSRQNHERLSTIQSKRFDTAEKQNFKKLVLCWSL
jgi:hypothetical protein